MSRNKRSFCNNLWEYAHKKLQTSDDSEPSFGSEGAMFHFTSAFSVSYGNSLPSWVSESLPECDSSIFNSDTVEYSRITPGPV